MKKTLAAVAILGAFAGTALADVTVYGRIDTGLEYTHNKVAGVKSDNFKLANGNHTGSRFGLKGSENINGLKVGFVLEGRYDSTNGKLKNGDGFFNGETMAFVGGDYGTLYAGRINSLLSDGGSIQMTGGIANAFDAGGFGPGFSNGIGKNTRYDKTIAYKTPVLSGFQVGVQASSVDTTGGSSKANRYFAVAANYKAGNFAALLGAEYMNKQSAFDKVAATWNTPAKPAHVDDVDDPFTVVAGGSYNFGFVKPYVSVAYFKHMDLSFNDSAADVADGEGYTVTLSADAPVLGGTLRGAVAYTDGEDKTTGVTDNDFKVYSVGAEYFYNLSKSTRVYAGLGYTKNDTDKAVGESETYKVAGGLVYYF